MSVRRGVIKEDCLKTFEKYILAKEFGWDMRTIEDTEQILLKEFLLILQESKKMEEEEMRKSKQSA